MNLVLTSKNVQIYTDYNLRYFLFHKIRVDTKLSP